MKKILILITIVLTISSRTMEPEQEMISHVPSLKYYSTAALARLIAQDIENSTNNIHDIDTVENLLKEASDKEKKEVQTLPEELQPALIHAIVQRLPLALEQLMTFTLAKTFTTPIEIRKHTISFNPRNNAQFILHGFQRQEVATYIVNYDASGEDRFINLEASPDVTYSANGQNIVTSDGSFIRIYAADNGQFIRSYDVGAQIQALAANSSDNTIIVATREAVSIWNPHTNKFSRLFDRRDSSHFDFGDKNFGYAQIACNLSATEMAVLNSSHRLDFTVYNLKNDTQRHIRPAQYREHFVPSMMYHQNILVFATYNPKSSHQEGNQAKVIEWNGKEFSIKLSLGGYSLVDLVYNPHPYLDQFAASLRKPDYSISVSLFNGSGDIQQEILFPKGSPTPSGALAYSADGTLLAIPCEPNIIQIYKNIPALPFDSLTFPQIYFLALTSKFKSKHTQIALSPENQPIATKMYQQLVANKFLKNRLEKVWRITYRNPRPELGS